jgi:protein ImuB
VKRSISTKSAATKDREVEVQRIIALLRKWGISTLGQFAALDKEQLGARLGPEAIRLWERAHGKTTRLLKLIQPPESFEETFEFENEIETIEPLLFMLRRFLQQLGLRLSALYLVAKELRLRIVFSNSRQDEQTNASAARTYEHRFKIPEPTNNIDILFRMLHTHLENFKSDFPIVAVLLEAEPAKPSQQQFGLFETSLRDPGRLYETLARLVGLLGADRVGTPVLEETHRPDAFRMEPFGWHLSADANETNDPHPNLSLRERCTCGSTAVREGIALRRFRPVASASVFLSENKPAHFRSAEVSGKVSEQSGPYFASGNWWDEKSWARAEWDLQMDGDVLCRSYQSGDAWKLDGIYD